MDKEIKTAEELWEKVAMEKDVDKRIDQIGLSLSDINGRLEALEDAVVDLAREVGLK